ncbi:MAG TPA: hypothetical protein ACFYEK_09020 [Candidatus Wunengus sp. YC60]|uniref:hypothetical protein n=1 Tax=Candidatus Wunengus sp. YC60 TaxID=3367697 RepID=UPI004027DD31
MKKYLIISTLIFIPLLAGCEAFDLVKGADGKQHTKIENTLNKTAQIVKDTSPAANTVFPGAGLIGTLVAGALAFAGREITNIVISKKRNNAFQTVVKGVEVGSSQLQSAKFTILKLLESNPDLKSKVAVAFDALKPVKEIISDVSTLIGNREYLDKHVQKITKEMKHVGEAYPVV